MVKTNGLVLIAILLAINLALVSHDLVSSHNTGEQTVRFTVES